MKHTVYIASDHAGFELKEKILTYFTNHPTYQFVDTGPFVYDENDDYPQTLASLCQKYSTEENVFGIVIGGSGTGEAIVANKYPHMRCALWYGGNMDIITLSRNHNNSNVLSLGARFISAEEAYQAITLFLETPFSEDNRHHRRVEQVNSLLS